MALIHGLHRWQNTLSMAATWPWRDTGAIPSKARTHATNDAPNGAYIFRLRYRQALSEVVASIVKNNEAPALAVVNARVPATVAVRDKAHFTQLVLEEFADWSERHGGVS